MEATVRWREELGAAEALVRRGRWEDAGAAWGRLAQLTAQVGDLEVADHAARAGADAWRRGDRPLKAAELLARVLDAGRARSGDAALMAGILVETGAPGPAAALADRAVALAADEAEAVLARDVRLGVRLARGCVAEAREDHAWLAGSALPGATWSAAFRGAQLARLGGDLSAADRAWERLARQLGPSPAAAGALAGILQEQGELHLLRARQHTARGDESGAKASARAAVTALEAAGRVSAQAQRRAGLLRAEAWAAVARARCGRAAVLPRGEDMSAWARSVGLPTLEAEILCALAELTGNVEHDRAAVAILEGYPPARARARLRAALGRRWPLGEGEREALAADLAEDAAWGALV